ncbi:MAG: hypothetical protein ABI970_12870, partial [Chloroflexota bacterium]
GGHTGVIRCTCVISVALAEPPAAQDCQFGGTLPHIRYAIRREYCNFCINCNINFFLGAVKSSFRLAFIAL